MSIWIISGINGKGKTSLLTEFGRQMAFDNERTRLMQHKIAGMNYNRFKLTIPEHTVASNYACDFRQFGRRLKQPRIVDPYRLGFQEDSEIKMHYILPYKFFIMVFIIPNLKRFLNLEILKKPRGICHMFIEKKGNY